MPEDIQAGDGLVNFFDEAGVETFHTGDCRPSFALAAEQDDACSTKEVAGKTASDAADQVESLLLRHRANDSANHRTRRPTTFAAPIAGPSHLRRGNSGIHDLDPGTGHACLYHHCFHGARDGDERIDSVTVFEAHLLGRKRDAPRHDESALPLTEH